MTVRFDYEPWTAKDAELDSPGNLMALAALQHGLPLGHLDTKTQERGDLLISTVEQGVVELIAGGIEYLRHRGYTAAELEQRVRAYLDTARGTNAYQSVKAARVDASIYPISNPTGATVPAATLALLETP